MVPLSALWIPILLSGVLVFVVSAIVHMVLPWHRGDYSKMAKEEQVLDALRQAGVGPGDYMFPHCTHSEMNSPETKAKFEKGPVGIMTVMPKGAPAMGKSLGMWFVYTLVVGFFTAYVASRAIAPGTDYLHVFRIVGTVAFLTYAGGDAQISIWWGRSWGTTFRHIVDGLLYGLVTAGAFGWLWPR